MPYRMFLKVPSRTLCQRHLAGIDLTAGRKYTCTISSLVNLERTVVRHHEIYMRPYRAPVVGRHGCSYLRLFIEDAHRTSNRKSCYIIFS